MSSRFRIGDLTLDTGRRLLLRDTKSIPLGPLTYRLLLTLVEAAPNVVSHDELIASIWAGRVVSPETISQRIKLLRDALSDDPHSPRYVELIRGQGYRLVPQVEVLASESPMRARRRWMTSLGVAFSVVAAASLVVWILAVPMRTAPEPTSIAVLPFADMSPAKDQQYFADGIAEEILTLLSKSTTLRVIARTSSFSFRDKDADVTQIADALGVTHILEGSVRKAGDQIRVTVRLVDASDGSRLWSDSYDQGVGDILRLQSDIARSIAAALKANLQNLTEIAVRRVNPDAYDLYLRGQQQLRLGSSGDEAKRYLEQAIAIDPEFIPGYTALGVVYVLEIVGVQVPMAENRTKLREIVGRGLRLAPDDAGLLALRGQLARYDGDIKLAEKFLARALHEDPSNSALRIIYPIFKLDQGHPQEALALNRRSLEIDPLNPGIYINMWASYLDLWNADEANAAALHFGAVVPPSHPGADPLISGTHFLLSGDLAASIVHAHQATARLEPPHAGTPSWLPLTYYSIGDLQTGDSLMEPARRTGWNASEMAGVEVYRYLVHGEIDEARRLAVSTLAAPDKIWGGAYEDSIIVRLGVDAMLEQGEARRAVDFFETLAPEYARYKASKDIDPQDFAPAPTPLKSAYSSYPALHFPDYIRALRAVGDEAGAAHMLDHLEAILELRKRRGLFIEERYAAEALALRGKTEDALNALERAERDRTLYHCWHLCLLHNEFFAAFRNHPRFVALVERIQRDLSRQRDELSRIELDEIR